MNMILAIAAGGAIGAVARYIAAAQIGHWLGTGFPWGILLVNIVGSFLMGILVESMTLAWSPSAELRALLVVGVLGAFTTFSTFALDIVTVLERGQIFLAALYIGASVGLAVLALLGGMGLMRTVLI
jgi:CrcB protein